jgi:hypothetical protein
MSCWRERWAETGRAGKQPEADRARLRRCAWGRTPARPAVAAGNPGSERPRRVARQGRTRRRRGSARPSAGSAVERGRRSGVGQHPAPFLRESPPAADGVRGSDAAPGFHRAAAGGRTVQSRRARPAGVWDEQAPISAPRGNVRFLHSFDAGKFPTFHRARRPGCGDVATSQTWPGVRAASRRSPRRSWPRSFARRCHRLAAQPCIVRQVPLCACSACIASRRRRRTPSWRSTHRKARRRRAEAVLLLYAQPRAWLPFERGPPGPRRSARQTDWSPATWAPVPQAACRSWMKPRLARRWHLTPPWPGDDDAGIVCEETAVADLWEITAWVQPVRPQRRPGLAPQSRCAGPRVC